MKLLCLHALPFGGSMWASIAARRHDVVAPTLYDEGPNLPAWAAAAFRAVGDDPVAVVGCSVGGSVALEMARQRPAQVAALMLIGTKPGVRREPSARDEAVALIETEGVGAAWSRYWEPLFSPATLPQVVAQWRREAVCRSSAQLIDGVRAFHDRPDASSVAAAWTKPLMAVVGGDDRSPSPSVMEPLSRGSRRSFHVVPACGHYVHRERPDVFDALVDRFMSNIDGPNR